MAKPSGSPKGTIRLWKGYEFNPGPTEEEMEQKQDTRGSINNELEEMCRNRKAQGTYPPRTYAECSAWSHNLHPYVDSEPRDNTFYLWTLYPESLAGQYKIILQGSYLNQKPTWKFWGSAYDFAHKVKNEVPNVTDLTISDSKKLTPDKVRDLLAKELNKIGVNLIESRELQQDVEFVEVEKPSSEKKHNPDQFGLIELADADKNPSTDSKMRDPYHKHFDIFVGSRANRIMKIALHVIETPEDEKEGPDTEWSVVPDEPSSDDKQEAIAKFKTRDEAVAWMHQKEGEKLPDYLEDEESQTASEQAINANVMHDWLDPEEAAMQAWLMRKPDAKLENEEM